MTLTLVFVRQDFLNFLDDLNRHLALGSLQYSLMVCEELRGQIYNIASSCNWMIKCIMSRKKKNAFTVP